MIVKVLTCGAAPTVSSRLAIRIRKIIEVAPSVKMRFEDVESAFL
jgi:hypothetical protein